MILLLALAAQAEELVLWHAWRGAEEQALARALDDFSAQTGHTVTTVAIPFGAFKSKLEAAVPRGNGPDVWIGAHDALGAWTAMRLVAPLPAGALEGGAFLPATVDAVTWQGAAYGVPLTFKTLVLLYDPERVQAPPATVDALLDEAARHTHPKSDTAPATFGLGVQAAETFFHAPWVLAGDGAFLGEGALDTPAHLAAYGLARRLAVDAGVAPAQPNAELLGRLYDEGRLAMWVTGPWAVPDRQRAVAAAPLPAVAPGRPARPWLTVDAAFVSAESERPDAAVALATALGGAAAAGHRLAARQAPARSDVAADDPLLRALTASARDAVPMPADPKLGASLEAVARALRGLLRGRLDPAQAAAEATTTARVLGRPAPPAADPRPWMAAAVVGLVALVAAAGRALGDASLRQRAWATRHDGLWIGPAALALTVLVVAPFLTGAAVSLFAYDDGAWRFVGITHFLDLLLARDWPAWHPLSFWFTLAVTLLWTATNVTLHVLFGVVLALALREPWIRLRPVFRALLVLPWAVPSYLTALLWKSLFHAQLGAINQLLGVIAGRPVVLDWFGSFTTAFAANLITNTWLGFPFMMVVSLGALQSIPRDLEEAAEIDGATWLQRLRHVVWPSLRPALLPAVILGSVWTFNMFNVIYLVSAGEPDGSTEILVSEAYRWAFSRGHRYGYAAAYAVLIFGVLVAWSRAANRLAGRRVI